MSGLQDLEQMQKQQLNSLSDVQSAKAGSGTLCKSPDEVLKQFMKELESVVVALEERKRDLQHQMDDTQYRIIASNMILAKIEELQGLSVARVPAARR